MRFLLHVGIGSHELRHVVGTAIVKRAALDVLAVLNLERDFALKLAQHRESIWPKS